MFEVPSLLTRKTALLIPGSVVGVVVNVAANWLLVPLFGAWGAAWAGVLTYLAFSFTILAFCRTQIKLSYPWRRFVLTSLGFCGSYVVIRYGCFPFLGPVAQIGLSVLVCGGWALLLFGREGMNWWRSQAAPVADEVRVTPAVRADQNTVICRS